jgi:hypothetical protein
MGNWLVFTPSSFVHAVKPAYEGHRPQNQEVALLRLDHAVGIGSDEAGAIPVHEDLAEDGEDLLVGEFHEFYFPLLEGFNPSRMRRTGMRLRAMFISVAPKTQGENLGAANIRQARPSTVAHHSET